MEKITQTEINKLVQLQLGISYVSETLRLVQDLGAESADIANIVAVSEEKYQITFQESEIAKIITPKDIFTLIQSKLDD